jgi:hypothetical protein
MKEPDYRGLAALAIGICGALGIFIVIPVAVLMGGRIGVGKDVLIALGGALVGAFATYMGMRHKPDKDDITPE